MTAAFASAQIRPEIIQQLDAALRREEVYDCPFLLRHPVVQSAIIGDSNLQMQVMLQQLLTTMEQILAQPCNALEQRGVCGGLASSAGTGAPPGRKRSRRESAGSADTLTSLQINFKVFQALYEELKVGVLLQ